MLVGTFLFLSVSTRDKRDEINIFVAGDPCRKEYPMLKVFATQVVVSRGYDGAAAIKFSEKGDAVRFRIGKKVYISIREYPPPCRSTDTLWMLRNPE